MAFNVNIAPASFNLSWEWTNNNVIESPPFGGGYIVIDVNSINVVTQYDYSSTTTTYNGSFAVNIGDSVGIYVYSYSNNTYGTETYLSVQMPSGTFVYNQNDPQGNPGSPSSEAYSFTVSNNIIIISSSQSY